MIKRPKYIDISNISLEKGKEYIVYITKGFATSVPIISMYKEYNPIFIFTGNYTDMPTKNFINLDIDFKKIVNQYSDVATDTHMIPDKFCKKIFNLFHKSSDRTKIRILHMLK